MSRETLVILRWLVVLFFVGTIVGAQSDLGAGFTAVFLMPVELILFLGLTTWIDRIDARLNPKPPVPSKIANKKAIVSLAIVIVAIAIMYVLSPSSF